MIAVVLIHMVQVFIFGAYKFPRELTWILGVFLLLMTLGMAFTGQVLRFDQDAYWGLGIGVAILGRVPLIGGQLVDILLGGPIIAGPTLTRFFALHVFVIPGMLLAFAGLHVWMVLKLGINEWPMPGRIVRRYTYLREYNELTHKDGIPFVPGAVWKDLFFSAAIVLAVAGCAAFFGPFGPKGVPDPTIISTVPKPDPPFLWIYTVLSFLPPEMETPFILIAPVVAIAFLIALPLFAGIGEKSWHRRPVAVFMVLFLAVSFAALTNLGTYTPWSPHMDAWSGAPVPPTCSRTALRSSAWAPMSSRKNNAATATPSAASAANAVRRSTPWPRASLKISCIARCCRAAATCPPTAARFHRRKPPRWSASLKPCTRFTKRRLQTRRATS